MFAKPRGQRSKTPLGNHSRGLYTQTNPISGTTSFCSDFNGSNVGIERLDLSNLMSLSDLMKFLPDSKAASSFQNATLSSKLKLKQKDLCQTKEIFLINQNPTTNNIMESSSFKDILITRSDKKPLVPMSHQIQAENCLWSVTCHENKEDNLSPGEKRNEFEQSQILECEEFPSSHNVSQGNTSVMEYNDTIEKLKEQIHKLQLKDAIQRQEISKLKKTNEKITKDATDLEKKIVNFERTNIMAEQANRRQSVERASSVEKVKQTVAKNSFNEENTANYEQKFYDLNDKIDSLKNQIEQIATEKGKLEETIKTLLLNREIEKTFNTEERTNPQENNPNFTSQRSETVVQETLKREETSQNIQASQNQVDTPSRKNIRECHSEYSEQKNKQGISGNLAIESPIENKVNTIDTPTKPNNKVVSKAFPNKKSQLKKNEYPHKRAATPSPTTKARNASSYSELAQKAKLMLSSKSPVIKEQKKKVKQTPTNIQQTNPSKNVVNNFQRELVLLSPERSEVSPKELSPSSIKFEPNASDCWTSQNRVNHNSQIFNVSRLTPVRLFQSPFDENQNSQERGRGFNSTNKPLKRLDFDNNEVDASLLNNVSPNVIEIINQFQSYRRSKSNPRSTPGGSNYNSRERPSVPSTFNGTFTNKFNGDLFSTYNSKGKENKRIDFEFIKELGLEQGFSTRTNQDSGKGIESNRIAFKTNESQMQENSNIIDFIEKEKLCIDSTKLTLEERTEYGTQRTNPLREVKGLQNDSNTSKASSSRKCSSQTPQGIKMDQFPQLNPFPVILNSSTQGKAISPRRAQVVLDALRAKMQKKLSLTKEPNFFKEKEKLWTYGST